jgi:hypothetical protein
MPPRRPERAMVHFWLATWEPDYPVAVADPAAEPILAARARTLAIEVIGDEQRGEYAVLFSAADDKDKPWNLACCIGFANGAKACSVWRDRGFPLVDAQIEYRSNTLSVSSPFFAEESAMRYEARILAITGIEFAAIPNSAESLRARYQQAEQAPDSALPATWIRRRAVIWDPARADVRKRPSYAIGLDVTPARYPSLAPFRTGNLAMANVWSGVMTPPSTPIFPSKATERASRADTFGLPAFRFGDVEVLGFRVDLDRLGADIDQKLARLIAPLNFHLERANDRTEDSGRNAITDFRYCAATRTVVIELLRYGSMKLKSAAVPLGPDDYQSQHELVVRVLVGRVDDDTAQAHAPAIYVPTIFVDNPWSKVLGRDVQGFDKRMANFCVARGDGSFARLLPDGRVVEPASAGAAVKIGAVAPLARISRINLVQNTGSPTGAPILDLDCANDRYDNWDAFEKIDLELALGSSSLAATRWRQSDFEAPEFRRSFARAAINGTLKGFHSIQVSPVGKRELGKAWITGTVTVDDELRIARPAGVVGITLHAEPSAPGGWGVLCDLLGIAVGQSRAISFPTGSWYRLKFSMDLTIDNGLDWTGEPA